MVTIEELAKRVSKKRRKGDTRPIPLIAHEICLGYEDSVSEVLAELARHRKKLKVQQLEPERHPKKPPAASHPQGGKQLLFPFPELHRLF